jgi:hypothetical protein
VRHILGLKVIPAVEIVSVCNCNRESSQRVMDALSFLKYMLL